MTSINPQCPYCGLRQHPSHQSSCSKRDERDAASTDASGALTEEELWTLPFGPDFYPAVERIVAARESAAATRARAEALAPIIALADQWNDTPDYTPSTYDQGCVDQRHAMTMQLLEVLPAPDTAGESA